MKPEILSLFKLNTTSESKFTRKDLYPFQKEAVKDLEKFHKPGGKASFGILKIPTGGGKTKTTCFWILTNLLAKDYKVVWIAHRRELLEQATVEFNEMGGLLKGITRNITCRLVVGGYGIGSQIKRTDDILLVSIQTLSRGRGESAFLNFINKNQNTKILFVIDEAHHSAASTYKYIIDRYIRKNKNYSLLGLTATPTRTVESERSRLLKLFDNKIISDVSMAELISNQILARPIPDSILTNVKFEDKFSQKEKEYYNKFKELHPTVLSRIAKSAQRNQLIVEAYRKKQDQYGKTLVFATDLIHCKTLAKEFSKNGFNVAFVHSGKIDNARILNDFKHTKKYDILINIEKLTEGFDCPDIQTIFLARPTQSEILFSQMVGRGLRGPKSNPPGTEFCHLISFMDHWEKFTGWLDVSEISEYSDEERSVEKDHPKKEQESRITPWNIIESVYSELLPYAAQIPYTERKMDYLPHGWFNLDLYNEEADININRKILVFDNQYYAWKEVLSTLSSRKSKPTISEIKKVYHLYFDDLPIPRVNETNLTLLVDYAFSQGLFVEPDYYTFDEKLEADPGKLATKIFNGKYSQIQKRNLISDWYNKYKLLKEIYEKETDFAREVNLQLHYLEYPEDKRVTIFSGNPFLKTDKIKLIIPETDDKVLTKYFKELASDKNLFPNGFAEKPKLQWTNKIMQCYFGLAYKKGSERIIKINKILNGKLIPKETAKFVLYHEMLHFDEAFDHSNEFYARERKYKDAAELVSILMNISNDYDIKLD